MAEEEAIIEVFMLVSENDLDVVFDGIPRAEVAGKTEVAGLGDSKGIVALIGFKSG